MTMQLRLREEALPAVRRQSLATSLFALGCALASGLALASRLRPQTDLITAGAVVALAGVLAIALDLRRKRLLWRQYTVRLEHEAVIVERPPRPPKRLARSEVRHIVRAHWPAQGLVLRGAHGRTPLFVPAAVERFDEVEKHLATWRPIERSRIPQGVVRAWPAVIAGVFGLLAAALGGRSAALVVPAASLLALLFGWSLFNVLRSHRLGVRAKALSLLLVVPVAFLLARAAQTLP